MKTKPMIRTCAVLLLGVAAIRADEPTFAIEHVKAWLRQVPLKREKQWKLEIIFTAEVKEADLAAAVNSANIVIFDLKAASVVSKARVTNGMQPDGLPRFLQLALADPKALDPSGAYALYIMNMQREGKPAGILQSVLEFPDETSTPGIPGQTPSQAEAPSLQTAIANSRDESDIYINGEIDTVSQAKPGERKVNGIADIKVAFPFYAVTHQRWEVAYNLKASSVTNHDPNSTDLGLVWDSVLPSFIPGVPGLILRKSFKVESNKNFTNADGIVSPVLRFPAKAIFSKVFLTPYAGGEFGGNFKSPLLAAQGGKIVRGVFGSDVRIPIVFHVKQIQGIFLEGNWTRRVLGVKELGVDSSDPKNLKLAMFARVPHDHAEAKLKIALNGSFGISTGYEWGELPPSYQRVHNMFKIGLLYQAAVKAQ